MEDIIAGDKEKSEVVSLNGAINGEEINVKLQFWKPEGIFAAWEIGSHEGYFKKATRTFSEGEYATYLNEEGRLFLGKKPLNKRNYDKITFIDLDRETNQKVKDQYQDIKAFYQSPSGSAKGPFETVNLDLAPDNCVSGDCYKSKMDAYSNQNVNFYFQPWRFQESNAIYFAWKFADRIGMYGSYEHVLWLDGGIPCFVYFEEESIRQKIMDQKKQLRGSLGNGLRIQD
ncbi:MAG: hypothetical protein ABEJ56_06600 [Candidatus Nanohaloarchaea archaeon]